MKASHYMFCIADESTKPVKYLRKNGKWTEHPSEAKWYAYAAYAHYWIYEHPGKEYKVYKVPRDTKLCPVQ